MEAMNTVRSGVVSDSGTVDVAESDGSAPGDVAVVDVAPSTGGDVVVAAVEEQDAATATIVSMRRARRTGAIVPCRRFTT